jgi:hypothetical protein
VQLTAQFGSTNQNGTVLGFSLQLHLRLHMLIRISFACQSIAITRLKRVKHNPDINNVLAVDLNMKTYINSDHDFALRTFT